MLLGSKSSSMPKSLPVLFLFVENLDLIWLSLATEGSQHKLSLPYGAWGEMGPFSMTCLTLSGYPAPTYRDDTIMRRSCLQSTRKLFPAHRYSNISVSYQDHQPCLPISILLSCILIISADNLIFSA